MAASWNYGTEEGYKIEDVAYLIFAVNCLVAGIVGITYSIQNLRKSSSMRFAMFLCTGVLVGLVIAKNFPPAPHGLRTRQNDNVEDIYPAYNISVPVDHFHNESRYEPHSNDMFNLRYFFDATYYQPGGPVIILQSGETSVTDRLPYLQKGIVYQLAKLTGGIGVILEHRYYGTSFPVSNLSTENMRFLTTEQAVADQAYFQTHVVFPGFEEVNLTAPGTPYIAYGGSYAGGMVAFLRKLYPEITWGAISSSGVTAAIYDYWEYYEPIRQYGPPDCISTQQKLVNVLDNILQQNDTTVVAGLKAAFGLGYMTENQDFANYVTSGIAGWQSRNWDPEVSSPSFDYYCGNISSDTELWSGLAANASLVASYIDAGGWRNESQSLIPRMLNWMGWINDSYAGFQKDYYSAFNASASAYTDKDISNYGALSWAYQYCTEWGYIQTGSGVPEGELPLVSRTLDLEYLTLVCRHAFNITSPPELDRVNRFGKFNISYPRLAIIGGETDPWRPASPLATLDTPTRINDTSTGDQPIILIPGAVHHWDENGLFPNETTPSLPPPEVDNAQVILGQVVQLWLAEWQQTRG